jgi:hypothetical protein
LHGNVDFPRCIFPIALPHNVLNHPFNGNHSHGSVEFPRRVFHVAWPGSVPKAFKNIRKATATMVIN